MAMPKLGGGILSVSDGWRDALAFLRHTLLTHFTRDLHTIHHVTLDANGLPYSSHGYYLPGQGRVYAQMDPRPLNLGPVQEEVALFVGPIASTQSLPELDYGLGVQGTDFERDARLPFGVTILLAHGAHEPVFDEEEDEQGRTPEMAMADGDVFVGRMLGDQEILTQRTLLYAGALHFTLATRCKQFDACRSLRVTNDFPQDLSFAVERPGGGLDELLFQAFMFEVELEQTQYVGTPT